MFPARDGARRVKIDNEIGEVAARIVEEHPEFTLQLINNELRLHKSHLLVVTTQGSPMSAYHPKDHGKCSCG